MRRRLDVGRRGFREHAPERAHARRHVGEQGRRLGGHVGAAEEALPVDAVVAADVVAIDVHDLDRAQAHAGTLDDEALHRRVIGVDVLHRRALLHLAEPPGSRAETFQHVHAHPHAGVLEGGLEDGADVAVRHELARAGSRLAVLPGFLVHQHAAGKELVRPAADLGALVEDGGEALRRRMRRGRARGRRATGDAGTGDPPCTSTC